jgi:hypothetical protein
MARLSESRRPDERVAESLSKEDQLLIEHSRMVQSIREKGLSRQDKLLIEYYRLVQSIRAELVDRIYIIGNLAIDTDSASSELQDKQDATLDVTNAGLDQSVRNLDDVQNRVRGLISLSIEQLAKMTIDNDLLGQIESYLLSQMSEAAQKEIERAPSVLEEGQDSKHTDCWQRTSRKRRKK